MKALLTVDIQLCSSEGKFKNELGLIAIWAEAAKMFLRI